MTLPEPETEDNSIEDHNSEGTVQCLLLRLCAWWVLWVALSFIQELEIRANEQTLKT